MKRLYRILVLCIFSSILSLFTASGVSALADFSGGWRLPFDGTRAISNGPGEERHIGRSAEAIDYSLQGVSFQVMAPQDGTVLDVLFVSDFGWVLRINHNNAYSFFAHLDPLNIYVGSGNTVKQGQIVAKTGVSGSGGSGYHLHFEGRSGAVAGDVYSGNSFPTRGNPGNWWNSWYSPAPNFQHDPNRYSGAAQYLENQVKPSLLLDPGTGRHLSAQQSPPNGPAGHMSNITDTSATTHFAASPSTPGTSYETFFDLKAMLYSCGGCWVSRTYTNNPAFTEAQNSGNQSESNGQHTYMFYDYNQHDGWSTFQRYLDFWTGNSGQRTPFITANYRAGPDTTVLEYCTPSAVQYIVYEYHGADVVFTYQGSACRILVHRNLSVPTNMYTLSAQYSDGTWSPWTIWLIVHF